MQEQQMTYRRRIEPLDEQHCSRHPSSRRNGECNGFGHFLQSILSPLDSGCSLFEGGNEEVDQADSQTGLPNTREDRETLMDSASLVSSCFWRFASMTACWRSRSPSLVTSRGVNADEGVIRCRDLKCFIGQLLVSALVGRYRRSHQPFACCNAV